MYQLDLKNTALYKSPIIEEIKATLDKAKKDQPDWPANETIRDPILSLLKTLFINLNTPCRTSNTEAIVGIAKPNKLGKIHQEYDFEIPKRDSIYPVARHSFKVFTRISRLTDVAMHEFRNSGLSLIITPYYVELNFSSYYGITKDETVIFADDLSRLEEKGIYLINPLKTLHNVWSDNRLNLISPLFSFDVTRQKALLLQNMTVVYDGINSLPSYIHTGVLNPKTWEKIIVLVQQVFGLMSIGEVHQFIKEYHCPPHYPKMDREKLYQCIQINYATYRETNDKKSLARFINGVLYILSNYVYHLCYETNEHKFKDILSRIRHNYT